MASVIKMDMGKVMQSVSLDVRITGQRVAYFRLWLAAQIMKLAGLVAGCEIRIEMGRDFDDLPPLPRTRSYMTVGDIVIPRQASVRHGSPLYMCPGEWGRKVDFYLDGVRQEQVVSYDIDAGYIRVFKLGADGRPFVAGDEFATEILHGLIEARPAGKE